MQNFHETFLKRVFKYIERSGMYPTDFGKEALGDMGFITKLKKGRSPTLRTADKVSAWMKENPPRRKRRKPMESNDAQKDENEGVALHK